MVSNTISVKGNRLRRETQTGEHTWPIKTKWKSKRA